MKTASDSDIQLATDLHAWVSSLGVGEGMSADLLVQGFRGAEAILRTAIGPDEGPDDFAVRIVQAARSSCEMRGTRTTFELRVGQLVQTFSMEPERTGLSRAMEGPDPAGVIAQQMRHTEALARMVAEFAEQSLREKTMLLERITSLEAERSGVLEREAIAMKTSVRAELEAEQYAETVRRLESGELDDGDAAAFERRVGVVAQGTSLVLRDLGIKEALTKKFEEIVSEKPEAAARVVMAMQKLSQEQSDDGEG